MSGKKPKVVTLCGSSRFVDLMAVLAWKLEPDEGMIVLGMHLLPAWYCQVPDHLAEHEGCADKMDELHKRKIDISDEVLIYNLDGYVGESTRSEIEYAKGRGKKIVWLEPQHAF